MIRHTRLISTLMSVCAVVTLSGVRTATADPLIDNLAEPTRAGTVLGSAGPDLIWAAQAFTTPVRVQLAEVQVLAGLAIDAPGAVAELRSGVDAGGPVVASFSVPALSETTRETVSLLPDVQVTLEPDTQYWVVMGNAAGGSFEWAYAEGNSYAGSGVLGEYAYSFDLGATWSAPGVENPYQIAVLVNTICPADFNGSGTVTVQDIFDFLAAYFSVEPAADFNQSSSVTVQDIFDFLAAYFAGC